MTLPPGTKSIGLNLKTRGKEEGGNEVVVGASGNKPTSLYNRHH